jgi:hypothetical protein
MAHFDPVGLEADVVRSAFLTGRLATLETLIPLVTRRPLKPTSLALVCRVCALLEALALFSAILT